MPNDVFSLRNDIKVEFEIATSGSWIWGISTWDGGDVWSGGASVAWTDLLCEIANIEINRGCSVTNNVFPEPGSGQATITMQTDTYDPFSYSVIHAGTPVQISYRPEPDTQPAVWVTLFVGKVQTYTASYDYNGNNIVTIQAIDSMQAFLNSVVPASTFTINSDSGSMLGQLAGNYWSGAISGISGGSSWENWYPVSITDDRTVGDFARTILVGALCYLWTTKDDELMYANHESFDYILNLAPGFFFSNIHSTDPDHVCMSDLQFVADSRAQPNKVIATWTDSTGTAHTIIGTNADAGELYGEITLQADTGQLTSDAANSWLDALTLSTKLRRVQSVTFQPIQRDGTVRNWHISDQLFNLVNVDYQKNGLSVNDNYVVTRQIDTITPVSWDTTLELWKGI